MDKYQPEVFKETEMISHSIFETARGDFKTSDPETGEDKDMSGEEIKKILEVKSGLVEKLEGLMDSKLEDQVFLEAIKELNEKYGIEGDRGGIYKQVTFHLPNDKRLRVKVFKDMENALSFATV